MTLRIFCSRGRALRRPCMRPSRPRPSSPLCRRSFCRSSFSRSARPSTFCFRSVLEEQRHRTGARRTTVTNRTKIYVALAASAFMAIIIAISAISAGHREEKLRQADETAKQNADKAESAAREREQQAAEYKQKIEYLEDSLSALR